MIPFAVLFILAIVAALALPLIPLRRRRGGGDPRVAWAGFPLVTVLLLAANVILFAGNLDADGGLKDAVALNWGMVPRNLSLVTLFTCLFLHGSWGHLAGNMIGLWLFGPHVEEALGRIEYLLFYLGAGIAGGLLHVVRAATFLPDAASKPLIGASGAIFGVLGLYAVRFWRAKMRVLLVFTVPAIWAVGAFASIQIVEAFLSLSDGGRSTGVANWAHVGGFLFGVLIALPLRMREDSRREYSLEDAEGAEARGNLDLAAAHYRAVLEQAPGDAAAHRALARVCVSLRQSEAAHRHFAQALTLYLRASDADAVAQTYGDALTSFEVFPLPAPQLLRIASACEQAQAFPLALGALSELCRDFGSEREGEMALLRLGRLHLLKLNQPENAQAVLREFLRAYPGSEWQQHAERLLTEAAAARQNAPKASPAAPRVPITR